MKFLKLMLLALLLAFLSGCATTTHTEHSVRVGEMGCGLVPFAGSLCKQGIRRLAERRQDDMYQLLGDHAVVADLNTPIHWQYKEDRGYLVVHSRSMGHMRDVGEFYVIEVSYFLLIDGNVENIHALTLVAIPHPDASQMGNPAYVYLWR